MTTVPQPASTLNRPLMPARPVPSAIGRHPCTIRQHPQKGRTTRTTSLSKRRPAVPSPLHHRHSSHRLFFGVAHADQARHRGCSESSRARRRLEEAKSHLLQPACCAARHCYPLLQHCASCLPASRVEQAPSGACLHPARPMMRERNRGPRQRSCADCAPMLSGRLPLFLASLLACNRNPSLCRVGRHRLVTPSWPFLLSLPPPLRLLRLVTHSHSRKRQRQQRQLRQRLRHREDIRKDGRIIICERASSLPEHRQPRRCPRPARDGEWENVRAKAQTTR